MHLGGRSKGQKVLPGVLIKRVGQSACAVCSDKNKYLWKDARDMGNQDAHEEGGSGQRMGSFVLSDFEPFIIVIYLEM